MLTNAEHEAMATTVKLQRQVSAIIGNGGSAAGDHLEFTIHLHAIQNMILAQSAAREHPGLYRPLGRSIGS